MGSIALVVVLKLLPPFLANRLLPLVPFNRYGTVHQVLTGAQRPWTPPPTAPIAPPPSASHTCSR